MLAASCSPGTTPTSTVTHRAYTRIEALQRDLQVSRLTAAKYLDRLTDEGFVEKHKIGRYNYYINIPLMRIFTDIPEQPEAFDVPAMARD